MSTSKNINKICVIVTVLALLVTVLFMNGKAIGIAADDSVSFNYENTLFDDSYVHTIDIVMDDWDAFIENATSEEYTAADVTIDGETIKNAGIRAKGNTSLSTVSQLGSQRYSLKIEFDGYEQSNNYHGLDKICLNNLIQDYTMMKDYIAYKLMYEFGVASPLVSYAYITVNGEDWGLYLAVEAVEDSFLERNYGTNYGELYKPDSMAMGGGRGNGGGFDMRDMDFDQMGMKNPFERDDDKTGKDEAGTEASESERTKSRDSKPGDSKPRDSKSGEGKTGADEKRLIRSIKALNEGIENADSEEIASAVDVDAVMRYMVVHNFVVNGDSYTGNMIHNYYLYEENGQMAMIPWDYNLAYGTFQGQDATGIINDPIDTPQSITDGNSDRPMFSWITATEEYTEAYHQYYQEFLDQFYTNGYLAELVSNTYEMLHEYVEKDPTKFCTVEEYEKGVETLSQFVELRCQSISGQIDGTIPSTDAGQSADDSNLIDASALTLNTMGSMGGGGFPGGDDRDNESRSDDRSDDKKEGDNRGGGNRDGKKNGHDSRSGKGSSNSNDTESQSNASDGDSNSFEGGNTPFGGDNPFGGDTPFGGGDNPFGGGDFSAPSGDFNFGASQYSAKNYIYLGVSAGAMLLALIFALSFKTKRKTNF